MIIFDLEMTFLFPWVVGLQFLTIWGVYAMIIFIIILTIDSFMNDDKER